MNNAYKKFKFPFIPLYLIRWKPNITSCIHGHYGKECNYLVFLLFLLYGFFGMIKIKTYMIN